MVGWWKAAAGRRRNGKGTAGVGYPVRGGVMAWHIQGIGRHWVQKNGGIAAQAGRQAWKNQHRHGRHGGGEGRARQGAEPGKVETGNGGCTTNAHRLLGQSKGMCVLQATVQGLMYTWSWELCGRHRYTHNGQLALLGSWQQGRSTGRQGGREFGKYRKVTEGRLGGR